MNILNHLDWVLGFTTLIGVELMIRQKWYAWVFSICNQFVWLTYIIVEQQYGLLPLNIALFFQNTRGLLKWSRLEREKSQHGQADHVSDKIVSSASESP